jgi:reactive intermediate/imine deaminase
MLRAALCALACWVLGGCAARAQAGPGAQPAGPEPAYIPMAGRTDLPFSAAVRVGPMLYLSGQIGTDSTGKVVTGGIQPETRQALENIRALLEQNGSSMDRVVKCTAMLADMKEWGAMNEVYVTFFPRHRPARSAFGTSGLALGARVEIECMAAAAS